MAAQDENLFIASLARKDVDVSVMRPNCKSCLVLGIAQALNPLFGNLELVDYFIKVRSFLERNFPN